MKSLSKREYKDRLYGEFARVAGALANPHRLELLDLLAQREERSVEDLASEAGLSVANASQHLKMLRSARLVRARREHNYVFYRVADEDAVGLWQDVRDFAVDRFGEVGQIVAEHLENRVQPSNDSAGLIEKIERGEVALFDARPREEFRSGHLPGAASLPPGQIDEKLFAPLDLLRPIVVYCRGPFCTFADEAVAMFRERGFDAQRLELGVPEWRRLGFAVAVGEP